MSEVILRRRNPLDVIRYVLQNLEKQAIAAGSYPTLIHEGLEAEEKVRAEVERLEGLIVALSEDERGLVTGEVHAEADRIRAALRGGGESKAHADDCPCVMCDPMQVRLDQQLRALRGGGE